MDRCEIQEISDDVGGVEWSDRSYMYRYLKEHNKTVQADDVEGLQNATTVLPV